MWPSTRPPTRANEARPFEGLPLASSGASGKTAQPVVATKRMRAAFPAAPALASLPLPFGWTARTWLRFDCGESVNAPEPDGLAVQSAAGLGSSAGLTDP